MHRLVLRLAAVVGLLLLYLPLHAAWRVAGRPSPWPRRFLGGAGHIAGLRTKVSGVPAKAPVLFVANHLSWLDILAIAGVTGAAFVSKAEVSRWPLVGMLARLNRTIYVERAARGAVRDQADTLRNALVGGDKVALFPEGTTNDGTALRPFRASLLGSLYPAIPNLIVQPVALDYGEAAREVAWIEGESTAANAARILKRRGILPVRLTFLEPIDPAAAGDRKALAAESRARIVAALGASALPADRL
jgi:1-acyl-sn-glycerol-3-phosphate acyltransferase